MSYAMARHAGYLQQPKFPKKLISTHKSNLDKAEMEGLLIEKQDRNFLLNKRGEWGTNGDL